MSNLTFRECKAENEIAGMEISMNFTLNVKDDTVVNGSKLSLSAPDVDFSDCTFVGSAISCTGRMGSAFLNLSNVSGTDLAVAVTATNPSTPKTTTFALEFLRKYGYYAPKKCGRV
eukprot:Platyproteum_vivax@DN7635_c0_g1_i4.p1